MWSKPMTDTFETPESPEVARTPDGRFSAGNPGRRPGAYGRTSRRVAQSLLAHFEAHQEELLDKLLDKPALYLSVVSRVFPRRAAAGMSDPEAWTEVEAARVIRQAQDMLAYNYGHNREAVAGLEALLERDEERP
jgi:hypothetical protein